MKINNMASLGNADFGKTQFVTGLRAYAAFLVIMIHAGGAGLRELGSIGNRIADLGATGVYIFFVISGFCIAHSLSEKPNLKNFWWKRFWRIAPLYYTVCLTALVLAIAGMPISPWREELGVQSLGYDVSLHFSFLSFLDYRVANSLVGVEWSIPIEVFWYALIPFALPFLRTWQHTIILFGLTSFVFCLKGLYAYAVPSEMLALAEKWGPFRYAPAFFLGMLAYRLRPWVCKTFEPRALDFGLALVIVVAAMELVVWRVGNEFLDVILLSFAIILLGGAGPVSSWLFERKIAIYLGTISYSLYLTHMFVIAFLPDILDTFPLIKFMVISIITIVVSSISYIYIEKRGMEFAQKLHNARAGRAST